MDNLTERRQVGAGVRDAPREHEPTVPGRMASPTLLTSADLLKLSRTEFNIDESSSCPVITRPTLLLAMLPDKVASV